MSKPQAKRASLGVALMARNGAETLPRCLASIRPHVQQIVVGVDVTTTDNTAKVAKKAGSDVVFPLVVSEEHTCPRHGTILAQHFAKARNATFAKLDRQLDTYMWLDADDVVSNPQLLPEIVERIGNSPGVGAWMAYHYAQVEGKATNTLFHRERILRTHGPNGEPIQWEWQYRVHEIVAPKNVEKPHWLMLEEPAVFHQHGAHKTESSAGRNLTLLEIDLEENPNDTRAIFYLGNQYFAMGKFREAVYWYERLGREGKNHYELWQSFVYASIACEKLGDLDGATQYAFKALDVEPKHPEPYLRLASVNLLASEFDKAIWWSREAMTKEKPPFFVFKNPLDYTFNVRMPLADALAAKGDIPAARAELEKAYEALPNPQVGAVIQSYKAQEEAKAIADSFIAITDGMDDAAVVQTYQRLALPNGARHFKGMRDRVMPAVIRRRSVTAPKLIIYCGRSLEEWAPTTLNTTGIGGSETAVVEIAQRFARDGWRVDVYNGAGALEGEYDGVGYWDPERYNIDEPCDLFVSWRKPQVLHRGTCPKALLWCHDLHYGPDVKELMQVWDTTEGATVCGVSAWHAAMLSRYYGLQRPAYLPNGINLDRFGNAPRKVPFQCVYASSPDRGLDRLLRLWPKLLQREPALTLHVGYGWENLDKAVQRGRTDLAELKAYLLTKMEQVGPSVIWRGRLPQDELAKLYGESSALLYPSDFLEVSCITTMEAMAAGCVPITTTSGAIPETVGDGGFLVDGMPNSSVWGDYYVNVAYGVLSHPNIAKPVEYRGRARAKELTWDLAFEHWKNVLASLDSSRPSLEESGELVTA